MVFDEAFASANCAAACAVRIPFRRVVQPPLSRMRHWRLLLPCSVAGEGLAGHLGDCGGCDARHTTTNRLRSRRLLARGLIVGELFTPWHSLRGPNWHISSRCRWVHLTHRYSNAFAEPTSRADADCRLQITTGQQLPWFVPSRTTGDMRTTCAIPNTRLAGRGGRSAELRPHAYSSAIKTCSSDAPECTALLVRKASVLLRGPS